MPGDARLLPIAATVFAALAARDWGSAMDAVESSWGIVRSVRPSLIRLVAEELPAEEIDARPRWLAFRQTVALTTAGPGRPERLLRVVDEAPQSAPGLDGVWLCVAHAATLRHVGRYADARDWALRGAAHARELEVTASEEERALLASALLEVAITEIACARFADAQELLLLVHEWAVGSGNAHAALGAAAELAWVSGLHGERVMAELWWGAAQLAREGVAPSAIDRSSLALAEAIRRYDDGDLAGAHAALADQPGLLGDELSVVRAACRAIVAAIGRLGTATKQRADLDLAVALAPAGRLVLPLDATMRTIADAIVDAYGDRLEHGLLRLETRTPIDGDRGLDDYAAIWHARLSLAIGDVSAAVRETEEILAVVPLAPRTRVEALALRAEVRAGIGARGAAAAAAVEAVDLATRSGLRLYARWLAGGAQDATLGLRRRPGYERVTAQELRVLHEVADGRTIPEIAERLMLSVNTIKSHRRSLSRKLGVSTRGRLIEEAYRRGLLV